ncbi:MAG TPA: hypothetical protein VD866_31325 [Urbifossiella sp.]|nr:hypothetical protein [Urbifossiella sp.]
MACFLCVLVVALPLVVTAGAAVMRAAVGLANRVLGRAVEDRDYGYAEDDYYLPPWHATAVPLPGFGKAVGIVAVVALVDLAAGYGLSIVAEQARGLDGDARRIVFGAAALASAFLIQTGIFKLLLPTTFPRASLVAAFVLLLGVPLLLVAGGLALVGLNAIAPNMGR